MGLLLRGFLLDTSAEEKWGPGHVSGTHMGVFFCIWQRVLWKKGMLCLPSSAQPSSQLCAAFNFYLLANEPSVCVLKRSSLQDFGFPGSGWAVALVSWFARLPLCAYVLRRNFALCSSALRSSALPNQCSFAPRVSIALLQGTRQHSLAARCVSA